MKFNFKKIVSVFTSTVMLTSTLALAAAANAPAPFVTGGAADAAVVVGSSASADDMTAAGVVKAYLDSKVSGVGSVEGEVSEDEVPLGGDIISGNINAQITDSDISSLVDGSISWDDGDGSEDYNIHEEIVLSANKVNVTTSLDDNDFTGPALINDHGIGYRLVLEDALNASRIDSDDADTLYLDIMGTNWEITNIDDNEVTVVTSEEKALKAGDTATVAGKTITVDNVFEGSVEVNGEIINDGQTKKIDGLRVKVQDIGYHSNAPESSVAILKIGEDISKVYADGDEFIGEDQDDPNWVWDIDVTVGGDGMTTANDYIGVLSDRSDTQADEEIAYVGEGFSLPGNFAEVKFVGLTDVNYDEFTVSFDDSVDLYNSSDTDDDGEVQNAAVVMIEAPNKDSITTSTGSHETNTLYLRVAPGSSPIEGAASNGSIEVFYKDVDGDIEGVKPRYAGSVNATNATGNTYTSTTVATFEVGDTNYNVLVSAAGGNAVLTLNNTDLPGNYVTIDLGGTAITSSAGTFEWLGTNTETTSKEDSEAADVAVNGNNVGTEDNDVMDNYGAIVQTPDSNSNKDKVVVSIPDEQVYANIAVTGNGAPVVSNSGILIVKDNEASAMNGKNLVVVGGSCINTVAAKLLGSNTALCGTAWEAKTNAGAGSFVISSYANDGKIATLVAGYNKVDTENAAQYLKTHTIDTTAGKMYKGTTATADALLVA